MTADGDFRPMQLIFQGKTERCIADVQHLLITQDIQGWDLTYSANHRSNLETMKRYMEKLLVT